MSRRASYVLGAGFLVAACGGEGTFPEPIAEVDTLPSGVVVVRNAADSGVQSTLTAREVLRLGAAAGDEAPTFADIVAIELDDAGRVYVLDSQTQTVRVFDGGGGHLRDLGGRGEGPGEFVVASGMVMLSDGRLLVRDRRARRYTAFDTEGSVSASHQAARAPGGRPVLGVDGRVHESLIRIIDLTTRESTRQFMASVIRGDSVVIVDSIRRPPSLDGGFWIAEQRPVASTPTETGALVMTVGGPVPIPFAPERQEAIDPRGGYWTGRTDSLRFTRIASNGDTLMVVERTAEPVPVTASMRDLAIAELQENYGGGIPADPADVPDHLPAWTGLFVDPVGRLWVERYSHADMPAPPVTWEIYDADGRYLGGLPLELSSDPTPVVRGDRIAGVTRDEFDVEYVVVYELEIGQ